MQQLTELDNAFLQMESSRTPMHITPVIFYDQSGLTRGKVRFKEILEVFERNLHKSKIFRRKLAGNTLGFDTPYWVEDPDFDLEFHVRHIALPKPGDRRQLCILLARLHARGLDMRRPLWEAYVIEGLNAVEGLPPKSFALMIKVHHAAIDGVSGAEVITALHSLTADEALPKAEPDWQGESDPPMAEVWSRAYLNSLKRPLKLVETVGELVPKLLRANRAAAERKTEEEAPLEKTRFNVKVGAHRVTDTFAMDLSRVKAIRQAVPGATVNDVIVSLVGGGMRKYLQAKGELPESSLICGAPINVRRERSSESIGNQVGMMSIKMATDVEDAVQRLQAVMIHAQNSKEYSATVGQGAMMDISQGLGPRLLGMTLRVATAAATATDITLPIHTVVSNVPGPPNPLYLAGARVHMMMGMGPLIDGAGIFHAVISASGKIAINFVACRDILPDPDFYQECLQQAYDELAAATIAKPARKKKRRKAKRA